jgi:hypothetical protein
MTKIFIWIMIYSLSFLGRAESSKNLKEMSGKFLKIEAGDYYHLVIEKDGKEERFWCYERQKLGCEELIPQEEKYKNKHIQVKYVEKETYIKEAEKKIYQRQAHSFIFKD